jgi:hypothetical protein
MFTVAESYPTKITVQQPKGIHYLQAKAAGDSLSPPTSNDKRKFVQTEYPK